MPNNKDDCFGESRSLISVMPRPVVGQTAVMKSQSQVGDDGPLAPVMAEMLRQQALYEHLCGVYFCGQLPVPPIFRMYTPPVSNTSYYVMLFNTSVIFVAAEVVPS